MGAENGAFVGRIDLRNLDIAYLRKIAVYTNIKMHEQFFCDGASSNTTRCLACRSSSPSAVVKNAIFLNVGKMGVTWTIEVFRLVVACAVDIFVVEDDGNGSARCFSLKHT